MRALFLLGIVAASVFAAGEDLTVAAAADLQPALTEIAARFEKQTGSHVKISFGSSGNFYSQIENGAPYDVFLSADIEYPKRLQHAGLTTGASSRYATGKIVLYVPEGSPLDPDKGLKELFKPSVRKVAIANPTHAPYGRAAEAALLNSGVWDAVSAKLAVAENISQAAQFVTSGNADAGILALSLVLSPAMKDKGRYAEIPQNLYPPIDQGCVVIKSSPHEQLAARFVSFLSSQESSEVLTKYGFSAGESR